MYEQPCERLKNVAKSYSSSAILKHLKAGTECACLAVFETCRLSRLWPLPFEPSAGAAIGSGITHSCVSSRKSKMGFLNPKESENGFCVSFLQKRNLSFRCAFLSLVVVAMQNITHFSWSRATRYAQVNITRSNREFGFACGFSRTKVFITSGIFWDDWRVQLCSCFVYTIPIIPFKDTRTKGFKQARLAPLGF